jgi:hypothetical protein
MVGRKQQEHNSRHNSASEDGFEQSSQVSRPIGEKSTAALYRFKAPIFLAFSEGRIA